MSLLVISNLYYIKQSFLVYDGWWSLCHIYIFRAVSVKSKGSRPERFSRHLPTFQFSLHLLPTQIEFSPAPAPLPKLTICSPHIIGVYSPYILMFSLPSQQFNLLQPFSPNVAYWINVKLSTILSVI